MQANNVICMQATECSSSSGATSSATLIAARSALLIVLTSLRFDSVALSVFAFDRHCPLLTTCLCQYWLGHVQSGAKIWSKGKRYAAGTRNNISTRYVIYAIG
jgi:hypothetical protein